MVIVRNDLLDSVIKIRDDSALPAERMFSVFQKAIYDAANILGVPVTTKELEYCEEGRLASFVPGHTEKCFVVYNPEHPNWMRFICTIHCLGNVNYYEFYQLSYGVKLPAAQTDLASSLLGKVKLFNNSDRNRKYWEMELSRIIAEIND